MDAPLAIRPFDSVPVAHTHTADAIGTISTLRRRAPLFLAVAGSIVAAAVAFTLLQTPRYTAAAAVMVAPHKAELGLDQTAAADPTNDASVDSQVEVAKSGALAQAVVDKLDLAHNPAFIASLSPGLRVLSPPPPPSQISSSEAIADLQKALNVHRVAQTLVLEIAYSSPNRDLATEIANAYANAFVQQSINIKLEESRSSNALLGSQLDRLRGQVEEAETAVATYKGQHNLLNVQGSTMAEEEIGQLDEQLAASRASAAEAAARLSTARQQMARGSNGDDVGEALSSPVIQELRKQREEVSTKLADLRVRFGPRFPEVTAAEQQIGDIDGQIDAEIHRVISNLDAQNQVAQRRAGSLQGSLNQTHGALSSDNAASVRLNELQRTADSERTLYEGVLNRVKETQTQEATAQSDARIVNYAVRPPAPSSPKLLVNLVIGLLLGAGAGIAAVVVRQELDTGLGTLDDIERRLRVPYFGALPTVTSALPRTRARTAMEALQKDAFSSFSEAFRGLAAALVHAPSAPGGRVIAITSALPKEGKTTAAVCLGRIMAKMGLKVVLIDCDLRSPSVAGVCRLAPRVGLLEVLRGDASLQDALVADETKNFSILPLIAVTSPSESPFGAPIMDQLLTGLKSRFDIVLLDTAPVLPAIETRLLSRSADVVVMLVRWRKTPEKAAQMALQLLRHMGVRVAGAALTRVDMKAQAHTGYGDPSFYYSQFKNYYAH